MIKIKTRNALLDFFLVTLLLAFFAASCFAGVKDVNPKSDALPEFNVAQGTTKPGNVIPAKDARPAKSPLAPAVQPKAEVSVYRAGVWTLAPFASYRVHEFSEFNGKLGGGLAAGYALTRNLTLEASTLSEGYIQGEPAVDSLAEASAAFKFYVPIKETGLAGYALLGYTRNLQGGDASPGNQSSQSAPSQCCSTAQTASASGGYDDRGDNRMDAGIGVEFRSGILLAFLDGVWTHDFESIGHARFRLGGGFFW